MIWFWQWKRRNEDLDAEIQTHFEMAEEDRMDYGENRHESKNSVRRQFGNADLVKEVTRDMWAGRWARDFMQDAAYALRVFRKNILVSAALVLIVGLGIGASTTLFSIADGTLRKGDPGWYRWTW